MYTCFRFRRNPVTVPRGDGKHKRSCYITVVFGGSSNRGRGAFVGRGSKRYFKISAAWRRLAVVRRSRHTRQPSNVYTRDHSVFANRVGAYTSMSGAVPYLYTSYSRWVHHALPIELRCKILCVFYNIVLYVI